MKHLLRAFLLCSLLSSLSFPAVANGTRYDAKILGELNPELVDNAFEIACGLLKANSKYECPKDLKSPTGVPAEMAEGTWGLYITGGRLVFLNSILVGPHYDTYAHGVLIHEVIHYIRHWAGLKLSACEDEALAWNIYNKYVAKAGREDLVNLTWRKGYPSCQSNSN